MIKARVIEVTESVFLFEMGMISRKREAATIKFGQRKGKVRRVDCKESELDSTAGAGNSMLTRSTHCWSSDDTKLSFTFWWIPDLSCWEQGWLN